MELVKEALDKYEYIKVIGIAGPGEPLAMKRLFETLRRLDEQYPMLSSASVRTDCCSPIRSTCSRNMMWVISPSPLTPLTRRSAQRSTSLLITRANAIRGSKVQKILLSQQLKGIEEAVKRHMIVKINTVYIPGINDQHIPEIAKKVAEMGVYTFNVIPLIAQYKFANITRQQWR